MNSDGIRFLCLLAFAFAHSAFTPAIGWSERPDGTLSGGERPNIVLIVADDMAHTDLGIAGHPVLKTPHLDRLAREGVRFTHAFTPNPICTPSRAAILTGQDCWTNDCYFFGRPIKPSSAQFATLLSEAGYETFYTGKWHNDGRPWTRGFTSGAYHFASGGPVEERQTRPWVVDHGGGNRRRIDRFSTTLITDAAVDFLEKTRPDGKPFLMFVSHKAPHDPWTPPDEYRTMYPPERIPLPANFMPRPTGPDGKPYRWFTDWHGTELRDEALMPYPRTSEGVRDVRSRYFGMVTQMDRQIGRILGKLEEKKLAENTLVIFVADHGISLGAHGFSGKQTMYEEGIRLPMILRWPGLTRGTATVDDLVSLIDIFPTICEAAGVPIPAPVEGRSLLDLYQGRGKWPRDTVFAAFQSPSKHRLISRAVRTERYKYIHNLTTDEVELYDLKTDPHELNNLTGKAAWVKLEKDLAAELLRWRKRSEPAEF